MRWSVSTRRRSSPWIAAALPLSRVMIEQFWDEAEGGFFYTGKDHETLIARNKDPHDNATPSGNSMAVTALLRLAKLTGDADLLDKARRTLQLFRGLMVRLPTAAGQMLCALDFHLGPVQEIAVVGDAGNPEVLDVLRQLRQPFRPHQVVAWKSPAEAQTELEGLLPLLKERGASGAVTTYLCENFTCRAPIIGGECAVAPSSISAVIAPRSPRRSRPPRHRSAPSPSPPRRSRRSAGNRPPRSRRPCGPAVWRNKCARAAR